MTRFRYVADPLCWSAVALYALNRWELKPHFASPFLHSYLSDLLLIPAALPVVLWLQRRLGLRQVDTPPTWAEMLGHLTVWSIICEVIGPFVLHHGTADLRDVVCYTLGGVLACLWWQRPQRERAA